MTDEQLKKLVERLVMMEIAIKSVNPAPAETIQAYRDQRQRGSRSKPPPPRRARSGPRRAAEPAMAASPA